jgi:hypothetical protein
MTLQEIEEEVRKLAHSLPPSDFGSTRAIQAVAKYVQEKMKLERDRCAEIADDESLYIDDAEISAARRIAAAIRDPDCHCGLVF